MQAKSPPITNPPIDLAHLRRLRYRALSYATAASIERDYTKRVRLEQMALRLWQRARKAQA
jgi:hypothetical protein